MVELLTNTSAHLSSSIPDLLLPGETIAVVDDSPEIVLLLRQYLKNRGYPAVSASNASECLQLLSTHQVALVLLDIGLPDRNGDELLDEIVPHHPDLAIIMVTGTTDLDVALRCLRKGADDYLTKPVSIELFHHLVTSALKKRRLAITSRIFSEELRKTNRRMHFLHHLNLQMNSAFLNTKELQGILQAILVGITSHEGLRFNRAFLALYNNDHSVLEGVLATGPASREQAGKLWHSLETQDVRLEDILSAIQNHDLPEDIEVNRIVQCIRVPSDEKTHVFIKASIEQKPINVVNGVAENCKVPTELIETLGEKSFSVVPLFSPDRPLGVIIVDNFVTGEPINQANIQDLEIFAGQASLAIEHSHLYQQMTEKIEALELATQELERNKEFLLAAERSAAIGEISGQLLHSLRNPLTSIGGTSRLLIRKSKDPKTAGLLGIISKESEKIETVLEDLFTYVEDVELLSTPVELFPLLRKCVMVFYSPMKKSGIEYTLDIEEVSSTMEMDESKIRQAFLHILRNAVEAMTDGGVLSIKAMRHGDTLITKIQDTGQGIPLQNLEAIRQPFFTTKTYGNGMGLAVVDKIIQGHGGSFSISTPSGSSHGTCVTIHLPAIIP